MLSERDIELAHPEAFDFVFGNLPPARKFTDYKIQIDRDNLPEGIEIIERV